MGCLAMPRGGLPTRVNSERSGGFDVAEGIPRALAHVDASKNRLSHREPAMMVPLEYRSGWLAMTVANSRR